MSRRASLRRFLFALAILVVAGSVAVARAAGYLGGLRTAPPVVVTALPIATVHDTLRPRETVSQLFERNGVRGVDFTAIGQAVRAFDASRLRAGMVFTFRQRHGEPEPHAVVVRVAHDTRLVLHRPAPDVAWSASTERILWRSEPFVVEGTVRSSVSDAITGALDDELLPFEARAQLVWSLADVYDWVVDFSRDVQEGDRFRVLAERLVSSEGEVRFGQVLAARLAFGPRPLYAYRFDDPSGRDAFYDEQGRSMRRELLRAPLEFRRISSGFNPSRLHPILRVRRAHQGIDFAAVYGTPIRSVGDGVVVQAGRAGGYGNLVEIRHNGRTTSRYAHLSDFGRGIHVGARVTQGQTIGFVGASGLATSPHLHYELRVNGVAVNPRRQFAAGEGAPIAAARRDAYEAERQRLHALLEPAAVAAVPVRSTDD